MTAQQENHGSCDYQAAGIWRVFLLATFLGRPPRMPSTSCVDMTLSFPLVNYSSPGEETITSGYGFILQLHYCSVTVRKGVAFNPQLDHGVSPLHRTQAEPKPGTCSCWLHFLSLCRSQNDVPGSPGDTPPRVPRRLHLHSVSCVYSKQTYGFVVCHICTAHLSLPTLCLYLTP